ncbi:MAG TPA: alpha-N-arabinofuranosidase [Galbitalea sp.]|jgi:alpha-N-arabinofuranosidase
MLLSRVAVHPALKVADVPPRLFGSFVEHMGRAVYGGLFEPGHPTADPSGLRRDVIELTRELGVSVVRYPGGDFVSAYEWEDGVGPVAERPRRIDPAWRSTESNKFGTDEFLAWCRASAVEPMMAVNLGTRGIAEAMALLEYTNHPGGSRYSDMRIANGVREPYGVKLWCLGNEMDGAWQIGHTDANRYGQLAAATAHAMRRIDPGIELVVCGSSSMAMPTFGSWEADVLEHAYDEVDYISLHAYYEQGTSDTGSFLASSVGMDAFIDSIVATADHVRARKRSAKQLKLSFDEWNVWGETGYAGDPDPAWRESPRIIEKTYDTTDAVVLGSLLMSLLRHADRVDIACLAQLVNVIGPIRSEPNGPAWRQTIFHPFAITARLAQGEVLHVAQEVQHYSSDWGDTPWTDVVVTADPETESLSLFMLNRHQTENIRMEVDLRAFSPVKVDEHLVVGGVDLEDVNDQAHPDRVRPRAGSEASVADGWLTLEIPPMSWSAMRMVATAK